MTAALGPFMMRHPDVKKNMEQFLIQHVLPEFASGDGYMRAIVRIDYLTLCCVDDHMLLSRHARSSERWRRVAWRGRARR